MIICNRCSKPYDIELWTGCPHCLKKQKGRFNPLPTKYPWTPIESKERIIFC